VRKIVPIVAALTLLSAGAAPALAYHPLTKREAIHEVKRDAFENHDVDYFSRAPRCLRFSRYLFKCVAAVVYFDGDSDCIVGRVRAVGPIRHGIRASMHVCE
jgi:hypothetical protein